jgi:hypothetical protein
MKAGENKAEAAEKAANAKRDAFIATPIDRGMV